MEVPVCFECGGHNWHTTNCSRFSFKAWLLEERKDPEFDREFRKARAEIAFHDTLYNCVIGYLSEAETRQMLREIAFAMRYKGITVSLEED